jgi:hypothetical protein
MLMSPHVSLLLNLLILVVHFVLIAAQTETDGRFMRAAVQAHAIPAAFPRVFPNVSARVFAAGDGRESNGRGANGRGANVAISHARLAKYLARTGPGRSDLAALSPEQRVAVFEALAQCGRDYAAAASHWRDDPDGWRAEFETAEHAVAKRLRSAAIEDEATLARLVRIVVSSAG